VAFSKDGIHFKPAAVNPVIPLMKFPARPTQDLVQRRGTRVQGCTHWEIREPRKDLSMRSRGQNSQMRGICSLLLALCYPLSAIRYRLYALCIIYFLYSPRINPLSSIFLTNDGSTSRLGSVCFACRYWSESMSSALFITGNDGNGTSSNSFLVY
jgi:hypothetical protein